MLHPTEAALFRSNAASRPAAEAQQLHPASDLHVDPQRGSQQGLAAGREAVVHSRSTQPGQHPSASNELGVLVEGTGPDSNCGVFENEAAGVLGPDEAAILSLDPNSAAFGSQELAGCEDANELDRTGLWSPQHWAGQP